MKKYVNMLIDAQDFYKLIDVTQELKKNSNDLYIEVLKILEIHDILTKLSL